MGKSKVEMGANTRIEARRLQMYLPSIIKEPTHRFV